MEARVRLGRERRTEGKTNDLSEAVDSSLKFGPSDGLQNKEEHRSALRRASKRLARTHLVVHHEPHPSHNPLHRVDLRKLSNVSEVPDFRDVNSFATLPFDVRSSGGGDSRAREKEELDEEGAEEESSNVIGFSNLGSFHSDVFEDGGEEVWGERRWRVQVSDELRR